MAGSEIRTKFVLEGEQQFRQAMSESAAKVKSLNAEQKLAKAQFKATGDAEKYAADQTRLLKEKIAEQEKAVKAAQDALERMTQDGVDKNSKAWQSWQSKLVSAQTALANTRGDMRELTQASGRATESAKDAASAVESIGRKVNFDAVISGIDGITSKAAAAIRRVAELARGLWTMEADASAWADTLITSATQYGVGVEELQRLQYASQIIDVNLEELIKGMDVVNQKRNGGALSVNGAALVVAGLDKEDAFWRVLDALGEIPEGAKRDAAAMEIFGESFRKLYSLIGDGAKEAWFSTMEEAPVVTEDAVKSLGEANNALVTMQSEFTTLKMDIASEMAPAFIQINEAVKGVVAAFDDFAKSEAGQAALANFSEAIASIVSNFADESKLQSALKIATDLVKGFGDALAWIVDHSGSIEEALKVIAGALGALKVSESVLKFLQLRSGLKGLFGNGAGAASSAASSAAASGASASGGALAAIVGGVLPTAAAAAVVAETVSLAKQALGVSKREYQLSAFGDDTYLEGWSQEQRRLAEEYYDNLRLETFGGDPEAAGRSVKAYEALVESFGGVEDEALKFDQILENLSIDEIWPTDLPDDLFRSMQDAADKAVDGMISRVDAFYSAGQSLASRFMAGAASVSGGGGRSFVSNLYISTMNMGQMRAQELAQTISQTLRRQQAGYGGSAGGF